LKSTRRSSSLVGFAGMIARFVTNGGPLMIVTEAVAGSPAIFPSLGVTVAVQV
jgi:hypothetical protein